MPRLSADDKTEIRRLILENMDRFIKRYYDDDRSLITKHDDFKRYKVVHYLQGVTKKELMLLVSISRTALTGCRPYFEDFVANICANVNGKDIVCRVDLKWENNIIGGNIISQIKKKFPIYEQQVYSGRKLITNRTKEFYEHYYCNDDNIESVDFDFQW